MISGDFTLTILIETPKQSLKLKRDSNLMSSAESEAIAFGKRGVFEPDEDDPALTHYYLPRTISEILIRDNTMLGICDATMELCVGEHDGTKPHPRWNTCGNWRVQVEKESSD